MFPPEQKAERYLVLLTRSRFDVYPPVNAQPTGTHSAVFVPNRPAQVKGNTKKRPAYVWVIGRERRLPAELRAHDLGGIGDRADHGGCVCDSRQSARRVPGSGQHGAQRPTAASRWRSRITTRRSSRIWCSTPGTATVCASSISRFRKRRAKSAMRMNVPHGIVRTYPVFKDGLIYWVDNKTGLHVARYTGPRANELPGPGSGTYEGNSTSPHR